MTDEKMNEQKEVPLLTAKLAEWLMFNGDRNRLSAMESACLEAIATGLTTVIPTAELEAKDARIAGMARCLAFFASVIQCGESWSPICQDAYHKAIAGETK